MNIVRTAPKRMTIEEFADINKLTMEVHERSPKDIRDFHMPRFYAHFALSDTLEDACLVGAFGDGNTEAEAIADYAHRISEHILVIDARKKTERELTVPVLSVK